MAKKKTVQSASGKWYTPEEYQQLNADRARQHKESTGSAYGDTARDNWEREHASSGTRRAVTPKNAAVKSNLKAAFNAAKKVSWDPVGKGKQATGRVSSYTTKSGKKVTKETQKSTWDPVGTGKKTTAKVKSAKRSK